MNSNYYAIRTRAYLENNHKILNLPFVSQFPHNSCETSSLILGKVLTTVLSLQSIFFVAATNSRKFEMHFWIEVNHSIFDITADQFEGVSGPLYGQESRIISNRFLISANLPQRI
jgi:hypothetical protein